jgi:Flp pilus assembly protein CpaB
VLDRLAEAWASAPPRVRTALGLLAIVLVLTLAGRGATSSRWGPDVTVVAAVDTLAAGHRLETGDVRTRAWPAELVPDGVVTEPTDAIGTSLIGGVGAGMPLRHADLVSRGPASMVRPGHVAIAVAADGLPPLQVGRWADLVGLDPVRGGAVVAADTRVLAIDAATVWFEVPREAAAGVAAAATSGALSVALLPEP